MSSSEVDSQVREVMAGVLDVEAGEIDDGFRRDDASAWDSMNHLRLISALEEAFGIRFTMKEVGEMESFGDVRQRVAERLQAG
ncbi:MAG TPA: acyl carrier protein [Thermoanaerobaculia bacterium]